LGDEVGDLCRQIGFAPYPEQQLVLNDVFALAPAQPGKSAAFEVAAIACRQNLKTGAIKQMSLGWLFVTDQRLVVWSAHEFRTSQEAFRDMCELIEGSAMLARRVKNIYRGNGDEAIELMSGARLIFKARTKGGGRGLTGSKVILDEAYALKPEHTAALLPTLIAVPDPQVVYGSSAGLAESAVLRSLRDRGRAGNAGRLAYSEWCAERVECDLRDLCDHQPATAGCALDREDLWAHANPVVYRLDPSMTVIRELRKALKPEDFARECLGWWDEAAGELVISEQAWGSCLDLDSQIESRPVFALDVSPSRSWAAIAAAGLRADGIPHIEVTSKDDGAVVDHRPGIEWVVPRAVELKARWPDLRLAIAGGTGSAAEALVPALVKAGIELIFVKAGDETAACGLFYDLATTKGVRHIGQQSLTDALKAARKNITDGEGAWRWGRRKSSADITPVYATGRALWVAMNPPVPEVSVFFFNDLDDDDEQEGP